MTTDIRVMAVSCSPRAGGRTAAVLGEVLAGASAAGVTTELVELGDHTDLDEVVARMGEADAFVFGSPMYRATYAYPFKNLMDVTPRGLYGAAEAPLTARAVAIVATAGSDHHMLGLRGMREILVDFFAAHVVSPGVYVTNDGFAADGRLPPPRPRRRGLRSWSWRGRSRPPKGSRPLRRTPDAATPSVCRRRAWMTAAHDRFRLDGRVAVVTGASSGLGVQFVLTLVRAGADVVLPRAVRSGRYS